MMMTIKLGTIRKATTIIQNNDSKIHNNLKLSNIMIIMMIMILILIIKYDKNEINMIIITAISILLIL